MTAPGGGARRGPWVRRLAVDVRFWSLHSWSWDDRLADADVVARIDDLTSWLLGAITPTTTAASSPRRPCVADAGCGTGNHAAALAAGGADVVGIDFAPAMLARAAAKSPASFVRADLRAGVPLRARSCDGVLGVYAAQFFELADLAAEIRRVLRPAGVVVLELPRPGVRRRVHKDLSWRHRSFQRVNRAAAAVGEHMGTVRVLPATDVDLALTTAGFDVAGHRDTDRSLAVLARLSA